jgi:diadenosine tetraphosphate (Ap4A) HIT family hydrolase
MTCVYCLHNHELRDEQILWRGRDLYLCAPRGQLVEGFLAIAPYRCIAALSHMPASYFVDLTRLTAMVASFYHTAYGTSRATFYEQGRGGGGASVDAAGGFPLHAHLACLPVAVDVHTVLARHYARRAVAGLHELPVAARREPYLYLECMGERFVYVAGSREQRRDLERTRLRVTIAELVGLPERGHWRAYPGDRELQRLIERWRTLWPR